ncbi:MAG TPA: MFS transporter [Acidimicrobiales bacterium]|nr:MFS transporter [Acidimicrobiales bacterium]
MDRKWWTLIAVCVGTFMLLLDITIVNVALPSIGQAFSAQLSQLQWVIDAYALSLAALLLTAGSLADLYGRRLVFAIGTAIFTAGSLLCGTATGALFLILARAGQGIGGATMFATSLALIAQAFSGRERGVALGAFGAVAGVAVALGPVLGGVITTELSWRWIFIVNVPVGIAAIALTLRMVDESKAPRARRPDWWGFVTFTGALTLLIVALIRGDADGWSSTLILSCLAASAAMLVAFVVIERRGAAPMFPLDLLRKPTFSGGLIAAFCLSASIFSVLAYVTLYLQEILHLSAIATGTRFLVLSGAIFIVASIAGRLTAHVPIKFLLAPGFLCIGIGLLLMHGVGLSTTWTHLIPGFVLAGVGTGLVTVPLASTAIGVVEPSQAGVASGVNSTFRQVGIATGTAALGGILTSSSRDTIVTALESTSLGAHAHQIANSIVVSAGAPISAPAGARATIAHVAQLGFDSGLNEVFVVGAAIAFAGAVSTAILIRHRDFVAQHTQSGA